MILDFTPIYPTLDFSAAGGLRVGTSMTMDLAQKRALAMNRCLGAGLTQNDATVLTAVIAKESGFDPTADSGSAVGIAQFIQTNVTAYRPGLTKAEYKLLSWEEQLVDAIAHYRKAMSGARSRQDLERMCWIVFSYWAYPLGARVHKGVDSIGDFSSFFAQIDAQVARSEGIDCSGIVNEARSVQRVASTSPTPAARHLVATALVYTYYTSRNTDGRLWPLAKRRELADYSLTLNGAVPGHVAATLPYLR